MRKLRVLQLGSPTGMYGAERWILALVKHLDPTQVESFVGVIADDPRQDAPLLKHAAQLGFPTVAIEAHGRANWNAARRLRKWIVENRIDILHTHFYKTDIVGLLAVRGTPCKIVTTPHGWSTDAGLALRLYEALDRALFPFFDAVVPLSDDLYRPLVGRAGSGLRLVRNGVDLSEIEAVTELAIEARRWRAAGEFVVGYIGQLIPRKGVDVLVRAFSAAALTNKRLVIVGDGPQRVELETLVNACGVAECTSFLGFRDDRIALLKGFDLFVLPSRLEGIPRCLMEAMAARVPVIVSDIPGSRDLVGSGRNAMVFPVEDCERLRASLDLCQSSTMREQLALHAHQHVCSHFSAAAMAAEYLSLFHELMRTPATRPHGSAQRT